MRRAEPRTEPASAEQRRASWARVPSRPSPGRRSGALARVRGRDRDGCRRGSRSRSSAEGARSRAHRVEPPSEPMPSSLGRRSRADRGRSRPGGCRRGRSPRSQQTNRRAAADADESAERSRSRSPSRPTSMPSATRASSSSRTGSRPRPTTRRRPPDHVDERRRGRAPRSHRRDRPPTTPTSPGRGPSAGGDRAAGGRRRAARPRPQPARERRRRDGGRRRRAGRIGPAGGGSTEDELPGSRELDEALEAFGDLGGRLPRPPATSEDEWPPALGRARRGSPTAPPAQASSGFAGRPPTPAYGRRCRMARPRGLSAPAPDLPDLRPVDASPRFDPMTALVVVDLQNDFADPAGSLAVAGADAVVAAANAAVARGRRGRRDGGGDPGLAPGVDAALREGRRHLAGPLRRRARGARSCTRRFELPADAPRVRKGQHGEDGYSGFTMRDPRHRRGDADRARGAPPRAGDRARRGLRPGDRLLREGDRARRGAARLRDASCCRTRSPP